jgi:hypothetical protein
VIIEGGIEWKEFLKRASGRYIDITEPVAEFVAQRIGGPHFRPYADQPAAVLYTRRKADEPLLVLGNLSSGSAVMGPAAQSSKRLAAHNAASLHSFASLLRSLTRPEKPLEKFEDSEFADLVGAGAAKALMKRAEELGAEYKSPAKVGGEHSQAAANAVYAKALEILEWGEKVGCRLEGYPDKLVADTDPLIIAALLKAQTSAGGTTPPSLTMYLCNRT